MNVCRFAVADLVFPNNEKLCMEWLTGYTISNALIYSTAILIALLNLIIVTTLVCK